MPEYSTLTPEQVEQRCQVIAALAHRGQVYKPDRPYIEHPTLVRALVPHVRGYSDLTPLEQATAKCSAWLHDVLEDTPLTLHELNLLGIPKQIGNAVLFLTEGDDSREEYIKAIVASGDRAAFVVKVADNAANTHNLDTLAQTDPQRAARLEAKYLQDRHWLGVEDHYLDNFQLSVLEVLGG